MKQIILAACLLLEFSPAQAASQDPVDFLYFYGVAQSAQQSADSIRGELEAARTELQLRSDIRDMALKLLKSNAITDNEGDRLILDYEIAKLLVRKHERRIAFAESIAAINLARQRQAQGEDINLRGFYELNSGRWQQECEIHALDLAMEQTKLDVQTRILNRQRKLYERNSTSLQSLLEQTITVERHAAQRKALKKVSEECYSNQPSWSDIQDMANR